MPTPSLSRAAMRLTGHSIVAGLRLASIVVPRSMLRRGNPVPQTTALDRTGILITGAQRLDMAWQDDEIIFPMYEGSLAHSFWRAQEFSLFRQSKWAMRGPVLDLGCGDGSFAAVLFEHIDYGSDIDPEALKIARGFNIYSNLIQTSDTHITLPDGSVNTVISNSVLEHVQNLDAVVGEMSRVLAVDGLCIFSVPVRQFARDLQTFFGRTESERINSDFYHRNLLEVEEWKTLLTKHGFEVTSLRQFQPAWFSFYYWMLTFTGKRAFGRIFPRIRERVWRSRRPQLVGMVRDSINGDVESGGNIFVIAKKRG